MRKAIVLSLLAVFLFTVPAYATDFKINNKGYDAETINKDGSLYVPVRFVAESLGCQVDYVNGEVRIWEAVARPPIYGDEKFIATVNSALDLLEQKDPADYLMVCENTERIWVNTPVAKPGFIEYAHSNGIDIAFTKYFLESEFYGVNHTTGALVHEATHNVWYKLFKGNGDQNINEKVAYMHEINALKLIGATQQQISEAENAMNQVVK